MAAKPRGRPKKEQSGQKTEATQGRGKQRDEVEGTTRSEMTKKEQRAS